MEFDLKMLHDCYRLMENVFSGEVSLKDAICSDPETYNEYLLLSCLNWYQYKVNKCENRNYYEQVARCIIKYFVNSYLDETLSTYVHNYVFEEDRRYPAAIYVWRVYNKLLKGVPEKALNNKKPINFGNFKFLTDKNSQDYDLLWRASSVSLSNEWEGKDSWTHVYITTKIEPYKIENAKEKEEKRKEKEEMKEELEERVRELEARCDKNEKKIKELEEKLNDKNKRIEEILKEKKDEMRERINKILELINK